MNVVQLQSTPRRTNRVSKPGPKARPIGRAYVTQRIAFAGMGLRDVAFALQESQARDPAPFRINRFFRDEISFTKFRSSALKRTATLVENTSDGHGIIKVELRVDMPNTPEYVGQHHQVVENFTFDAGLASESEKALAKFRDFFDVKKHKPPYIDMEKIPAVGDYNKWTDRKKQVLFKKIAHASLRADATSASVCLTFEDGKSHMNISLKELEAHSGLSNVNGRLLVLNDQGRFSIYNKETFGLRYEVAQ